MKAAFTIIIGCLLFLGCKPKDELCTEKIYRIPCSFAFAGYTAAELDTIYLDTYAAADYAQLVKRDTFISPNVYIAAGIAYRDSNMSSFGPLGEYPACDVVVPAASRHYQISKVVYDGDSVIYYTAQACRDRTFVTSAASAIVNGASYPTESVHVNNYYVVLHK